MTLRKKTNKLPTYTGFVANLENFENSGKTWKKQGNF